MDVSTDGEKKAIRINRERTDRFVVVLDEKERIRRISNIPFNLRFKFQESFVLGRLAPTVL